MPSKAPDKQQWDNKGCSALKAALKNTVLPDAAYLAQLADEGGILPRNQDLPPGSCVTLADLEKWDWDGNTVGALIISYPWRVTGPSNPRPPPLGTAVGWARLIPCYAPLFARGRLDADHPDRNGEQLRKIAPVLKIFAEEAKQWGGKVGVFIDYCSLPQRSRASHRAGAAAAEAARAAAKAAGAGEEAQDKAAAEAHKSKDDRTPEELATFAAALAKCAPPCPPCPLLFCSPLLFH